MSEYCYAKKCFEIPCSQVDGVACRRCDHFCYCVCPCETRGPKSSSSLRDLLSEGMKLYRDTVQKCNEFEALSCTADGITAARASETLGRIRERLEEIADLLTKEHTRQSSDTRCDDATTESSEMRRAFVERSL